jgi:hypothetical protein
MRIKYLQRLFDLTFFEDHVFAHNRIVLFQFELLGLGTWVLFRDVEKARVSGALKFNLDGRWFSHSLNPLRLAPHPKPGAREGADNTPG